MKFNLAEVLDAYLVLDDTTGERVSFHYTGADIDSDDGEPGEVAIEWVCGGEEYTMYADAGQNIESDGDTFKVVDSDGEANYFRAYTIVRLSDVPELR